MAEKKQKQQDDFLVSLETYLAHQVHLGTKVISPDMRHYIYRRKADGVAVFNTLLVNERMKLAIKFLSNYNPEDVIVVCKREEGWYAVKKFSEVTGIKAFIRKYPAGILTNPKLDNFIQPKLVFVVDPWQDRNAVKDAKQVNIPVMAVCTSSSRTAYIDFVLPANNRNELSLALVFYLLAKGYNEARAKPVNFKLEDFIKPEQLKLLEELKKKTKEKIKKVKQRKKAKK